MNKLEAINKLNKAAKIYENNFCNKNLLILFDNAKNPNIIEIKAFSTNFLHLTGVSVNEKSILNDIEDKNSNIKEVFYLKCLNGRLKADDFEIKKDGSTDQKLDVLFSTLNMSKNVKMIGDYNKNRVYLQTDKLIGNPNSCLGLYKNGNYYTPNTVLKGDIRIEINSVSRVFAILSKQINDHSYNEIKYFAKDIDVQRLLDKIKDNISIDEKLLKGSGDALSAPNVSTISYTPVSYSGGAAALSPNSPNINLQSFVDKVKDSIGNVSGKKLKQQYEVLKEEIKSLKNQLFQKDKQIAKKDSQIADLIKASNNFIMERNALKEVCEHQKNVINRTNQWINANPDVK